MNYRPEDDAHFVAKRRQYIKRKKKTHSLILALLCLMILAVWGLIAYFAFRYVSPKPPYETMPVSNVTETENAELTTAIFGDEYYFGADLVPLEIRFEEVFKGALVLVSDHLGHGVPPLVPELMTVWGNKSPTYRVASSSISLAREAFFAADEMFCAYNEEYQNGDYQITMAYTDADSMLCCSEHGTGYAFDVNVYTKGGISYKLAAAREEDPMYAWIYENAPKYGFVLRYGEGKSGVTGMPHDADHFRYVGKGHSQYMSENDLSLEEYIGEVQKHPYEGKHLEFSCDDTDYEVFYVKIAEGAESVTVDIPDDVSYTLSGDNIGGVIVALYK